MIRISAALAVIVAALAVTGSVAAQPTATKLTGTVGPGFTITLKDSKGKKVTSLKAGSYTITVTDKSGIHNFVVEGAGIPAKNKEVTGVGYTGTKTSKVFTFQKGKTYTYVCTPHRAIMKGTFKVT